MRQLINFDCTRLHSTAFDRTRLHSTALDRTRPPSTALALLLLVCAAMSAFAVPRILPGEPAPYTATVHSTKLFTEGLGKGGIRGKLVGVNGRDIAGIFAVSRDRQKVKFEAGLGGGTSGSDRKMRFSVHIADIADDNSFAFTNLLDGIYDLIVLLGDRYYDGMVMGRGESTLGEKDIEDITRKITDTNPYFNKKALDRMWGTAGEDGTARILVQEVRTLPVTLQDGTVHPELQTRVLRLYVMQDISAKGTAAWSVEETREILRQEVGPPDTKGVLPEHFLKSLSGIVVVDDEVEDIGALRLSK